MPGGQLVLKRAAPMALVNPYKRYRYAYMAAGYAYRHRKAAYRAARTIGRAYRRYRRKGLTRRQRRVRIGERIGHGGIKRFTTDDVDATGRTTRNLNRRDMTAVPKTTTNDIDSRQRDVIAMSGFKVCMEFLNNLSDPLRLNMAVIAPKAGADQAVPVTGFFRGTGNTRGLDFSNQLSSNDFGCRPINADKYTILYHKRVLLNGKNNEGTGEIERNFMGTNYFTLEKYFKINRQIRFNSDTDTSADSKVYFIWWCDQFQAIGGSAPIADAVTVAERYITYFREPKN